MNPRWTTSDTDRSLSEGRFVGVSAPQERQQKSFKIQVITLLSTLHGGQQRLSESSWWMRIATATATQDDSLRAGREVVSKVQRGLEGARPDLAFLFLTPQHAPQLEEVVAAISKTLDSRNFIGCTAESVIGGSREHEREPAITLWAAHLPGVEVRSSHVRFDQTPDGTVLLGIPTVPADARQRTTMFLLAEPFSFSPDLFIDRLAEDHPGLSVIGGMASGAHSPGENRLFLGPEICVDGAVAVTVSGEIRVRSVVSQGCRPFGRSFVVTKTDRNFIVELGGKPALQKIHELAGEIPPLDRALLQRGLHLGVAIDASKREHRRGDFLVRSVVGVDQERGALAITDVVRAGQTVQFHLRDAASASEDLQLLLEEAANNGSTPSGALMFSCNGRGQRLFKIPDHDARTLTEQFADVPVAGFFAAGEFGPVGGQNFLHGFTASIALFEPIP